MDAKCELERKVIENTLSIATTQPAEVARKIMKGPGYTGIVSGECIHLIKCLRVETLLRATENCYEQLPVTFQNQSMFLAPRMRILVTNGKEVQYDGRLPPMFKLGDQWYRSLPQIVTAPTPEILTPQMTEIHQSRLTCHKWHIQRKGLQETMRSNSLPFVTRSSNEHHIKGCSRTKSKYKRNFNQSIHHRENTQRHSYKFLEPSIHRLYELWHSISSHDRNLHAYPGS
ncbi:hypothetical protein TKK_0011549 [Trichogramma kaykai]